MSRDGNSFSFSGESAVIGAWRSLSLRESSPGESVNVRENAYQLYRLVPQPANTFDEAKPEASYQLYSDLCAAVGLLPVVDGAIQSIGSYCGVNEPAWPRRFDYVPTQGWVGRGGFFPGLAWATSWGGQADEMPGLMAFGICGAGCGWSACGTGFDGFELIASGVEGWDRPLSPVCGREIV